ncbi:unnamed protein product [Arctogadus glacialis]
MKTQKALQCVMVPHRASRSAGRRGELAAGGAGGDKDPIVPPLRMGLNSTSWSDSDICNPAWCRRDHDEHSYRSPAVAVLSLDRLHGARPPGATWDLLWTLVRLRMIPREG